MPHADAGGHSADLPPIEAYEGFEYRDEYPQHEQPPAFDEPAPLPAQAGAPASALAEAPDVLAEIRAVIAAHHGRSFAELSETISQIASSDEVLERLDDIERNTVKAIIEILSDITTTHQGGAVDLTYVPLAGLYDSNVRNEFDRIGALATTSGLPNAALAWQALRERVQRDAARRSANRYVRLLDKAAPVEDLVTAYQRIAAPTTRRAATRSRAAATAAELAAAHKAANGNRPKLRISSGWPTVDLTFTARNGRKLSEPLGFITPGEGFVVAGPTGTGKTSWTYGFVPSAVQDLIGQGELWSKVLFAHTEEESVDKIRGFAMLPGQPFHHLADNLIVANIGTSRQQLAMAIYDNVADAAVRSKETGVPIDRFLIRLVVLDYIQSLIEAGENDTQATIKTAEFLLRGVQMWNPEEMAKWSGISYREYTGQPWPEGMDHHRVAGVYMAQLVKQDDSSLLYRPGDRKCHLSDFALEATDPDTAWKGPDGNLYAWEVKEGDLRLFKQNAIRGSGVILQNATAIIILHRSRAYNNPASPTPGPDGRRHLLDTRARLLLDKMRTGGNLAYIPMSFDLDPEGFRARYLDPIAEAQVAAGQLKVADCFQRSSDPMVPIRRTRSAFDELVY